MELNFIEQKIKQLEAENKSLLQKNHEISDDCFRLIKLYRDAFLDVTGNIYEVMSSIDERINELDRKVNVICKAVGEPQLDTVRPAVNVNKPDSVFSALKAEKAAEQKSKEEPETAFTAFTAEPKAASAANNETKEKAIFKSSVISDIDSLQSTIDKMRSFLSFNE